MPGSQVVTIKFFRNIFLFDYTLYLFEAEIDNQKVQVLFNGNEFHLCLGKTRPAVKVSFVHDIQKHKMTNGKPLKIDYMRFYPKTMT